MEPNPPQPSQKPESSGSKHQRGSSAMSPLVLRIYDSIFTSISPSLRPLIQTIFQHSASRGLARLLAAITISHILRFAFPQLLFFWPHALAEMKLARSSPHFHLQSSVAFSWAGFAAWSLCALGLRRATATAREGMRRDAAGDGWCVLFLVLGTLSLEGAYVQTCWCGAQLWAYYALFRSGEAEHAFLEAFLAENSWRVMAQLGLLVGWLVHGVFPALRSVLTERSWLRGAAYAVTVYVTVKAVKKSNKYFLLLEMMDVWVMAAWLALGTCVAGMDRLRKRAKMEFY